MAIQTRSSQNTEIQSVENDKTWSWSIQPLVTWIRILGVDLPESCSTSCQLRNRRLTIFYGIFCFVLNFLAQFEILYYIHVIQMEEEIFIDGEISFSTTTAILNYILDFWNYAINGAGIHLLFLLVIQPRWSGLIQIFQRCHIVYDYECYCRIRKLSLLGITYIIISVRFVKIYEKFYKSYYQVVHCVLGIYPFSVTRRSLHSCWVISPTHHRKLTVDIIDYLSNDSDNVIRRLVLCIISYFPVYSHGN